jgi:hypothetical protein
LRTTDGSVAGLDARKINQISWGLLAVGLTSGVLIYILATPVGFDPLIGDPMTSKRYVRELMVFGGKSNVLMARFMEWFKGLWQGPQLGVTVAVLTVMLTLAFRFVAARPDLFAPGPEFKPDDRVERP